MSLEAKGLVREEELLDHLDYACHWTDLRRDVKKTPYLSAHEELQGKSREHIQSKAESRDVNQRIVLP
jgi:hypothetical protein